jgi:uncharacterized protein
MSNYYDPIYGQIDIDDKVIELISNCSELKRLRFVGMMNFKSLKMLPLTTISRLEHCVGLAYLMQIFVGQNFQLGTEYNNLLVAALYHDVNCGPFGHSVEWAIDRHVDFEHESDAEWIKAEETLSCLINKPIFIEQDGLHRYGFDKKYKLNLDRIDKIITGHGVFFINNKGIDLDNIDNVFRMAHYLGILSDRSMPKKLVLSLRASSHFDNFIIPKSDFYLMEEWYRLRSTSYQHFIYSTEYMGYEYLIFELISEYSKALDRVEDVKNLFHYTDERLLWSCYDMKQAHPRISNIAKRLLLHDIPNCYGILMSEDVPIKTALREENVRKRIVDIIQNELSAMGHDILLNLHLTTDDRKTNRQIDIYVDEAKKISPTSIGEDRQYVLLAILGEKNLAQLVSDKVVAIAIDILKREGFSGFFLYKKEESNFPQKKLF